METSRALRILAATAIVSALAILLTSPAQARPVNEGDAAAVVDSSVVNAVAGAQASQSSQLGEAVETSSGSDGFDRRTLIVIAGGVVLVLGAGALLVTPRQRRVTLS